MAFLLDEDAGMKELLNGAGLTVSDERNAVRPVKTWFGMPDVEVRQRSYPFLTIDLIAIAEDKERQRSGAYRHVFQYTPDGYATLPAGQTYTADVPPEAYTLTYQVSSWARNPRHDRQLLYGLLSGPLPLRWGQVAVGTGASQTYRRLDISMAKRDSTDSDGKRLFRNIFTCQMSSELFYWQLAAIKQATSTFIDGPTPTTTTAIAAINAPTG